MIEQTLKRANVESICQYILYGDELLDSDIGTEDNYELFIDSMCKQFENKVKEKLHNQKLEAEIIQATLPLLNCLKSVYIKIGIQSGSQLAQGIDKIRYAKK